MQISRSASRWPVPASISALAGLCLGLAACGSSSSSPTAEQSPVGTTLAWFRAVNDHNMQLAQEQVVPSDRDIMNWSSWGRPFKDLHCRLESGTANTATVRCSFSPITDADTGMSGDSFWTVHLRRPSSGRWLIDNYGQG